MQLMQDDLQFQIVLVVNCLIVSRAHMNILFIIKVKILVLTGHLGHIGELLLLNCRPPYYEFSKTYMSSRETRNANKDILPIAGRLDLHNTPHDQPVKILGDLKCHFFYK